MHPTVVMTIAVADSVHILIVYFYSLRNGKSRYEALVESMRINANPVFITSLTTIIGVLCLNFSDSPPYRMLGNMVAVGVFFAFCLSMTLLPALLAWFPLGKRHVNKGDSVFIENMSEWIVRSRRWLLPVMASIVILLIAFIPQNVLTEKWHHYFDETFEVRQTVEAINNNLSGVNSIFYVLDSGQDQGVFSPAYLLKLDKFANWLRQQSGVVYVNSLVDVMKRINRNTHGDDPAWYRTPEQHDLAAQLFLLYELGLPRELDLSNMVNFKRSSSVLFTVLKKTDSEQMLKLDQAAQTWAHKNATEINLTEGTGFDMVFAHINHRNIRSLLWGAGLALVLISFVLIFALKSIKLGLISLIPNLAPAAMAYGTWGISIGMIDLSASVVICMSLGIVVDDTVHFLSKYLYARRTHQFGVEDALRYAFHTVGLA